MHTLIWFLIFIYGFLLLFVLMYSSVQFTLAITYIKNRKKKNKEYPSHLKFPHVTVQLPIYNEKYVAARLIQKVAELDYPLSKFEIQVLDDSSDDTVTIIDEAVEVVKQKGIDISIIRREDRVGFKAGALAYATPMAKGGFIAIFDADFIPIKSFLKDTIGYFSDEKVGLVQSRWEHLNKNYNLLTKLQAFGLDAHFSVEQEGRNLGGHFINFNGTAGIWRKTTIADAGGWQSDTLTEDLDLSYRAQLKGWQFKYIENIGSPAELPPVMNALKTQQYRWTKGGAECAVKNLPRVLENKELDWKTKIHSIFHLLNSFVFICIFLTGVLSVPMLLIKNGFPEYDFIFEVASLFSISFFFLMFFYWTSVKYNKYNESVTLVKFILNFPIFLSIFMGLSLHNSIAVIEGYLGRATPFVRTPKFNLLESSGNWYKNNYLRRHVNPLTYLEIGLGIYFMLAIGISIRIGDFGLLPFHIMLFMGYVSVGLYSFIHSARS
ncbi:MAG: cellulose synthase family protein [Salibacteraceae bacterium]